MLESQIFAILLQRSQNWDLQANWCLKAEPALLLLMLQTQQSNPFAEQLNLSFVSRFF